MTFLPAAPCRRAHGPSTEYLAAIQKRLADCAEARRGYAAGVIYLDNNATTRIAPEVLAAMMPFLGEEYSNPSSPYTFARRAALAVARARGQVAALVGAMPEEIYFTSGGTEANNAALNHLILASEGVIEQSSVEHASVRRFLRHRSRGEDLILGTIGVDENGALDAGRHEIANVPLALMWANNETGVLFPVQKFTTGRRVHTDAVQAAGKIPLSLSAAGVETAAFSAHKIHGPKGVGALFIRKGTKFAPFLIGGDQEGAQRAGTENVAGIVGMGAAAELAMENLAAMEERVRVMRDEFEERMSGHISDLIVAGRKSPRLPNTSMLVISRCETEALIALLDLEEICVSSGSACASGAHEPSHVLQAMGLAKTKDVATIRVSLSRFTTPAEIAALAAALPRAVRRLRNES